MRLLFGSTQLELLSAQGFPMMRIHKWIMTVAYRMLSLAFLLGTIPYASSLSIRLMIGCTAAATFWTIANFYETSK